MFMEMLSAIAPFFVAGLLGTVFARFTGINMSMCVLLMFLYMGAKPVECIAAMLMFNVFTYFTVYSQLHVMKIKSFTFFPRRAPGHPDFDHHRPGCAQSLHWHRLFRLYLPHGNLCQDL